MHSPETVAHEIKYPWFKHKPWPKGLDYKNISIYERDQFSQFWPEGYRETFITIWHIDPCKPGFGGSDDTCGWFMRAHHGNKAVLEKIVKRFEEDWDKVFKSESGHSFDCGYFHTNGYPRLSPIGIVLNLFFLAANEHFNVDGRSNWKKTRSWMQANLFDIIHFAENTTDSLHDTITRKFERGCNEPYDDRRRKDRILSMASCIYGWILRATRPWYKHPRWHVHHWRFQIHPWQTFRRWALSRCCKCGKRFKWGESPVTDSWNSPKPKFLRGETDIYHGDCNNPGSSCCAEAKKESAAE